MSAIQQVRRPALRAAGRRFPSGHPQTGAAAPPAGARQEFLELCDTACNDLDSPLRRAPFYIDAYAVRALAVAYDLTGNTRYLDSCRQWSKRMVAYQQGMTPAGAYYMHYRRKPGDTRGNWYVADGASIAMGVLATAVRCRESAEKQRYLHSVEAFAKLVLTNYIGPEGGVRNGGWDKFDGQWWCSSGVFGSLCFVLYRETGQPAYRAAGLQVIAWLNHQDPATTQPYDLKEMGPALPMYVFEAYSAGLPYLQADPELKAGADKQLEWFADWVQRNLPLAGAPASCYSQWGSKCGGLPFHEYVYAAGWPGLGRLRVEGDRELARLPGLLAAEPTPQPLSQLAAFSMMSYAERLLPGAIYRSSSPTRLLASPSHLD